MKTARQLAVEAIEKSFKGPAETGWAVLLADVEAAIDTAVTEALKRRLAEVVRGSLDTPDPKLFDVPFMIGDGTGTVMLKVKYISGGFPRDERSSCAFCHGDPCNESDKSDGTSLIALYYKRNKHAETCPCCDGRAS